jgi:hypothetical protein
MTGLDGTTASATWPTAALLADLDHGRHELLLARVDGTVRFDLVHGGRTEPRLVRIDRDVRGSAGAGPADRVATNAPGLVRIYEDLHRAPEHHENAFRSDATWSGGRTTRPG